eukprot:2890730-Rhodomonas_salina.1
MVPGVQSGLDEAWRRKTSPTFSRRLHFGPDSENRPLQQYHKKLEISESWSHLLKPLESLFLLFHNELENMWRRVAMLVVLVDTVAGFQGSWLPVSSLRTPAPALCASSRPVAPRLGLRGARSQMGFNTGDESSKSGGSSGAQSGG